MLATDCEKQKKTSLQEKEYSWCVICQPVFSHPLRTCTGSILDSSVLPCARCRGRILHSTDICSYRCIKLAFGDHMMHSMNTRRHSNKSQVMLREMSVNLFPSVSHSAHELRKLRISASVHPSRNSFKIGRVLIIEDRLNSFPVLSVRFMYFLVIFVLH